jgi:hypothetical protein
MTHESHFNGDMLTLTSPRGQIVLSQGQCASIVIMAEMHNAAASVAADKPAPLDAATAGSSLAAWASGHCPTCHQHKDVMGMPCSDPWHLEQVCAIGRADRPAGDDAAVEKMTELIHSCDAGDSNNRVGVSAHDECYVLNRYTSRRIAPQILAAIRRGEVPGVCDPRHVITAEKNGPVGGVRGAHAGHAGSVPINDALPSGDETAESVIGALIDQTHPDFSDEASGFRAEARAIVAAIRAGKVPQVAYISTECDGPIDAARTQALEHVRMANNEAMRQMHLRQGAEAALAAARAETDALRRQLAESDAVGKSNYDLMKLAQAERDALQALLKLAPSIRRIADGFWICAPNVLIRFDEPRGDIAYKALAEAVERQKEINRAAGVEVV